MKSRGKLLLFSAIWLLISLLLDWEIKGVNKGDPYNIPEITYGFQILAAYLTLLPTVVVLAVSGIIAHRNPDRYKTGLKLLTMSGICLTLFIMFRLYLTYIYGFGSGQIVVFLSLFVTIFIALGYPSVEGKSARSLLWFHVAMLMFASLNLYIPQYLDSYERLNPNPLISLRSVICMPFMITSGLSYMLGLLMGHLFPCFLLVTLEKEKQPYIKTIFFLDVLIALGFYVPLLLQYK